MWYDFGSYRRSPGDLNGAPLPPLPIRWVAGFEPAAAVFTERYQTAPHPGALQRAFSFPLREMLWWFC